MKLIRFGQEGKEKPGIQLENGQNIDISHLISDFDEFFFAGDAISQIEAYLGSNRDYKIVDPSIRLGPPLARPSKLICVGLNYAMHAKESGAEPPKEPVLFFKSTTAICGPNDDLIIPPGSIKTDYEVELAIVIGKKASYVKLEDAFDHIFGYCLHNDYSEREFQLERGGQWVKGKSCDHFAPLGPFIVTKDEITEVQNLRLWTKLNGRIVQDSNTSDMIFPVNELVSYISHFMTLLPGDVITTGTPAGVGLGMKPPTYVKEGDEIEIGVDQLGISKQRARNFV